jgi:hypothetical protein
VLSVKTLQRSRHSSESGTPSFGGQYRKSRRRALYATSTRKSPTRYTAANQPRVAASSESVAVRSKICARCTTKSTQKQRAFDATVSPMYLRHEWSFAAMRTEWAEVSAARTAGAGGRGESAHP